MSRDFFNFLNIVFGSLEIRKDLAPEGFYDLIFRCTFVMIFPNNKEPT